MKSKLTTSVRHKGSCHEIHKNNIKVLSKKLYFLLAAAFMFITSNAQVINFPDPNLKTKLVQIVPMSLLAQDANGVYIAVDQNGDGEITVTEALRVKWLDIKNASITSLQGMEFFTNMRTLYCLDNNLTQINLSGHPALVALNASNNPALSNINVSGCNSLYSLALNNCNFTSFDLNGLPALKYLELKWNHLSTLDVHPVPLLQDLIVTGNQFEALDLSGMENLRSLVCEDNELTALDLSGLHQLTALYCMRNQLTTLDCSDQYGLAFFSAAENQLRSLFIKNGSPDLGSMMNPGIAGNPNLAFICCDENRINLFNALASSLGYQCEVNSYCSFVPGGKYYSIKGNTPMDFAGDGCSNADAGFRNLKFTLTGAGGTIDFFANDSGNYQHGVQEGTYTITPKLENPTYFSVSPVSMAVDFPSQTSPLVQDFCITPNGIHSDLAIYQRQLGIARPGFDASYAIRVENRGNQLESGTISLDYNSDILHLVTSNPAVTTQSQNLMTWQFTELQPFETLTINFDLHLNSPTEMPPVNTGNQLTFNATVASNLTDENLNDNHFQLVHEVRNAQDPNDITCLEGNTIAPEMVGKEVHYIIRFENSGTANAENIVVKDMIDVSKFDINSLIPLDGSHTFVTKISAGNKVELIFENINLPFDDANNDGYVAFKIKTKPTLVIGNTFSNTASIYFDYNFPIITNTATTAITALATHDFEMERYFRIYPNPTNTVLNIDSRKQIDVSSISIYNTLGQLVLVIPNAQKTATVDVSNLKTGNYFIKIVSDKGTSNAKFIKN